MKIPKAASREIAKNLSKSLGKFGQSSKTYAKAAKAKANGYAKKTGDKIKYKYKSFTDASSNDENEKHRHSRVRAKAFSGKPDTESERRTSRKYKPTLSSKQSMPIFSPGYSANAEAESSDATQDTDSTSEYTTRVRRSDHRRNRKQKQKKSPNALEGTGGGITYTYQLFLVLLFLLVISSVIGLIFVPLGDQIAKRYSWYQYEPKVSALVITFGLAAASSLVLVLLVVLTQLTILKNGSGNACLITIIVVAFIFSLVAFVCSLVQQSKLASMFGKEFDSLFVSYEEDHHSKLIVDTVQVEFECCGIDSYGDWQEIETSRKSIQGLVPFSCCDMKSERPCVHEKVDESVSRINYRFPDDLSIYQKGCRQVMRQYYDKFIVIAISLSSTYLVLEFLLFVMSFLSYN